MSDYFNASGNRIDPGTTARSNDVNALRDEVGAGFDLLPTPLQIKTGVVQYAGVSAGSANAQTVTMPYTRTVYADGDWVVWRSGYANTGALTLNVDSLGAKSVVGQDAGPLVTGDILANSLYSARYSTTSGKFHLMGLTQGVLTTIQTDCETAQTAAEAAQAAAETAQTAAEAAQAAAETSETNAAASETAAAASETAAAASETAAAASETAAAISETSAAASLDEFTDLYLGAKASDPTLDNDGDALQDGALYFNNVLNVIRVYSLSGTSWSTFATVVPDVLEWDTTIRTAAFTAAAGAGYPVDTTGGAVKVTLPAGVDGQVLGITDAGGSANTNNIEIDPNGTEVIMDGAAGESLFIDKDWRGVQLMYSSTQSKWVLVDN